jgi:hypothetical protein
MASEGVNTVEMATIAEASTANKTSVAATSRTISQSPVMLKEEGPLIGSWLCADGRTHLIRLPLQHIVNLE